MLRLKSRYEVDEFPEYVPYCPTTWESGELVGRAQSSLDARSPCSWYDTECFTHQCRLRGRSTGWRIGQGKRTSGCNPQQPLAAAELIVDGKVFNIGLDWVLRIGLVRSKDLIKGMLLEAEYRPRLQATKA
jgi:hypothetical protein